MNMANIKALTDSELQHAIQLALDKRYTVPSEWTAALLFEAKDRKIVIPTVSR